MKFLLAILIASQAMILLDAQQQPREQTFGVVARDSVVRQTNLVTGGAVVNHVIDFGWEIRGVRTFDLTPAGTSSVRILEGAINQNRMVFNISGVNPGDPFNVRITAFSGSALVHASALIMAIAMMFVHFFK